MQENTKLSNSYWSIGSKLWNFDMSHKYYEYIVYKYSPDYSEKELLQYRLTYVHFRSDFHFTSPFPLNVIWYMREGNKNTFQFEEIRVKQGNKASFHGALKMLYVDDDVWILKKWIFRRFCVVHSHGNCFKLKAEKENEKFDIIFISHFSLCDSSQNVTNVMFFHAFWYLISFCYARVAPCWISR